MGIDVSAVGAQTFSPGPTAREPEITATGRGETHLPPTFAVIMIGVTTRAGTAAEAAAQNAGRSHQLLPRCDKPVLQLKT